MRRLIFLEMDLTQIPDKVPQSKWKEWEKKIAEQAVKIFEKDIKSLTQVKIIKNYLPDPEVLIEFADDQRDAVYDGLRAIQIVSIIDSFTREK